MDMSTAKNDTTYASIDDKINKTPLKALLSLALLPHIASG